MHFTSMVLGPGKSRFRVLYQQVNRSRWEGTLPGDTGNLGCANGTGCSCTDANADGSGYNDAYKLFLTDYFVAQVCQQSDFNLSYRRPVLKAPGDGSIGNLSSEIAE